jgi:hypothetical protein
MYLKNGKQRMVSRMETILDLSDERASEKDWLHGSSVPKRMNDGSIFSRIEPSYRRRGKDSPISVLSLPAAEWAWEKGFMSAFPEKRFKFVGVESNEEVYRKMVKNAISLKEDSKVRRRARFYYPEKAMDMLSFLRFYTGLKSDFIYLDWMGTWANDKEEQLDLIFQHKMFYPGCFLSITISLGRGQTKTNQKLYMYTDMYSPFTRYFKYERGDMLYKSKSLGVTNYIWNRAKKFGVEMSYVYHNKYDSLRAPEISLVYQLK